MQSLVKNLSKLSVQRLQSLQRRSMPYYAVAAGWEVGIFESWDLCEPKVKGFSKPKYKKFKSRQEAQEFLKTNGVNLGSSSHQFDPKIAAVPLKSFPTSSGNHRGTGTSANYGAKKKESWKDQMEKLIAVSKTEAKIDPVKSEQNPIETGIIATKTEKSNSPEPELVDSWPDDIEWNCDDDKILLAASEEVEGISENSGKRKNLSVVDDQKKKIGKYTHESKEIDPIGIKTVGGFEFNIDSEGFVIVYTDGSCLHNGNKNAVGGFGVFFSDGHPLNAASPVSGRVTNNSGEIQAAIYAIKVAKEVGINKLSVSTDSQFLINSVTWMKGWKRNSWKLVTGHPVKNQDDFKTLDQLLDQGIHVKWNYVRGHKGIDGNEKADRLAREGARRYSLMQKT